MLGLPLSVFVMSLARSAGAHLEVVRQECDDFLPTQNQTIEAYRYRIYPYIEKFNTFISFGKLREDVIEVSGPLEGGPSAMPWDDDVEGPSRIRTMTDLNCIDRKYKENSLRLLGYDLNASTRWLA